MVDEKNNFFFFNVCATIIWIDTGEMKMKNVLVFDFGGTSIKYSEFVDGKLGVVDSFPTPATWDEMKEKLMSIKEKYETNVAFDGATFSFPGCVDNIKGEIVGSPAIKYIINFPIKKELELLLGMPVSMENDANCAALAECWMGAAKDVPHVLFVVVGTGVGGGIIVDGKLHAGAHLYGGEFGFMILEEDEAGTPLTLSKAGTAVQMAFRYCERKGVPHGTFSGKEVFELADAGDVDAQAVVEHFYANLSKGLVNLQLSFDPEMIVIGGGLSANATIIEELNRRVNEWIERFGLKDFTAKVVACEYKNDANLYGAIRNFDVEHDL